MAGELLLAQSSDWAFLMKTVKSGVGCGGATWGGGGRGSEAEVQINPDGTVEVRCGTQDLGTLAR